jgi:Domain of unknown function (DUF1840)
MIYKFKSPATGDVIMLGPQGDQLLKLLGREPAPKGIIEHADMPAAVQALQDAVARAEQPPEAEDSEEDKAARAVGLRQRVWPMVEMLRRAHAEKADIVWGV